MPQTTKNHDLAQTERELLQKLRHKRRALRHKEAEVRPPISPGERVADWVADHVGSWHFILGQSALLVAWIIVNSIAWIRGWDPYPFILLNLVLSFQAAYTAPIIMMSQNRAALFDRKRAEDDYHINIKAELEIEQLHHKVDVLREQEIAKLIETVELLSKRLEAKSG